MFLGLLLFAPAIVIGWLLVRLFIQGGDTTRPRSRWMSVLFEISLGAGLGVGVVSMLYFALLWAGVTGRAVVVAIEAVLIGGGIWLMVRRTEVKSEPEPGPTSAWIWLLRVAAILVFLFFAMDAAKSIEATPDGGWDAFTIWNLKAKYLAGGTGSWRNVLASVGDPRSPLVGASHPDYPLLLPGAVASAWTALGETTSATPAALALLFALATAGILGGAVGWLRGEPAGLLALLLLLASEGFASQAGSQNADIPLALYLVGTLTLIAIASNHEWSRGMLVLAGLSCGLAAWTKNEGIPFAILAVAAVAWKGGRKAAGWMSLGALPAAMLLAAFDILLVPKTAPLFPKTLGQVIAKTTDFSRWLQITESFVQSIWQMGTAWAHPVLLVAILAFALGLAPRALTRKQLWLALPVVGLLAADFAAYLLTIADLSWQLSTSNLRLIVQVWPVLLLLAFLVITPPALPEARAIEVQKPARGKAERKRSKGARVLNAK